ncbi:MAG: hypothetical protein KKA22_02845 [Gammaproteobacteria bacterium]|nr:hypothetical protein [Gammaproteobacteria bacterium]MBU1407068.1 hypothetical protein [Gammaproteobacteria bacterium]
MKEAKGMGAGAQMAALERLISEDLLAMSDEDLLKEAIEDGIDPATKASELRSSALAKINQAKREKLAAARRGYDASLRESPVAKARPALEEIKRQIQALIRGGASNGLSLAFRKGETMSDADWESLWDDMVESGLIGDSRKDD